MRCVHECTVHCSFFPFLLKPEIKLKTLQNSCTYGSVRLHSAEYFTITVCICKSLIKINVNVAGYVFEYSSFPSFVFRENVRNYRLFVSTITGILSRNTYLPFPFFFPFLHHFQESKVEWSIEIYIYVEIVSTYVKVSRYRLPYSNDTNHRLRNYKFPKRFTSPIHRLRW